MDARHLRQRSPQPLGNARRLSEKLAHGGHQGTLPRRRPEAQISQPSALKQASTHELLQGALDGMWVGVYPPSNVTGVELLPRGAHK